MLGTHYSDPKTRSKLPERGDLVTDTVPGDSTRLHGGNPLMKCRERYCFTMFLNVQILSVMLVPQCNIPVVNHVYLGHVVSPGPTKWPDVEGGGLGELYLESGYF